MPDRQRKLVACAWALDEVERQLRTEPAHRLRYVRDGRLEWSLDAPNGVGVFVEAEAAEHAVTPTSVEVHLSALSTGLLGRTRLARTVYLSLTGPAARVPAVLYLVFMTGGHTCAFESLDEAAGTLEAIDLVDGHYLGAFSDRGEVITIHPAGGWLRLNATGTFDPVALAGLLRDSRTFGELADDPHRFALAVWHAG